MLFEAFRIELLQEVATGVFCMVWASRQLHVAWTPGKLAMLFFFGICAGVIYLAVFLLLTTVSFWFEERKTARRSAEIEACSTSNSPCALRGVGTSPCVEME